MKTSKNLTLLAAAALTMAAGSASAAVILQPDSTTASTIASASYSADNASNQSGLSGTFTSGVDDFATTLSTLTHTNVVQTANTGWASQLNPSLNSDPSLSDGLLTIDMGSSVAVSRIGIWMYLDGDASGATFDSTKNFEVFSSTDGTADSGSITSLGTFSLPDVNPGTGLIFDITDATSRYFLVNSTSLWNDSVPAGNDHASIGEVVFEAIPEPSAALLGGLGLLALLRRRR